MSEVWKPIKGYEGIYEVSSYGRVRSLDRIIRPNSRPMLLRGRELHQRWRGGYLCVTLYDGDGNRKDIGVAILVASNFVKGKRQGLQVNHIDENKENNRADNLEWVTAQQNMTHGTRLQRAVAHNTYYRKSIEQADISGNHIATYESIRDAMRATGVNDSSIIRVCKGKVMTAGGYRWKYLQTQ